MSALPRLRTMSPLPLSSGMPAAPAAPTEQPQISKEAAAIENMAHQAVLFKGIEGFTPRVLTAKEATQIKTALADEKTDNLEKVRSFIDQYEDYGSLGDIMMGELELAPAIRAALDLALADPRQEPFAGEVISMLFSRNGDREKSMHRLTTIAGTNAGAQKIFASLKTEYNGFDGLPVWQTENGISSGFPAPQPLPKAAAKASPPPTSTSDSYDYPEVEPPEVKQSYLMDDDNMTADHPYLIGLDDSDADRKISFAFPPEIKSNKERAALRDLDSGTVPPTPHPKNKRAVKRHEEANRFREKHITFYQGERPEQRIGHSVWEAGQNKWQGTNPETRLYYIIGSRPLEGRGGATGYRSSMGKLEHRHFISSDGKKNRGLMGDGFRAESPELVHQYDYYNAKKYDAELIEQAMVIVEGRMQEKANTEEYARKLLTSISKNSMYTRDKKILSDEEALKYAATVFEKAKIEVGTNMKDNDVYSLGRRNCQDYIGEVLKEADTLAKQNNKTLILQ